MIKLTSKKGFGITELMMSTAVFGFIMAGLCSMCYVGSVSWQSQSANANAQGQLRNALDVLCRDFRAGSGLAITQQTSSNVGFTFSKSGEGTVTYSWTNTGASANRLLRTTATGTRIVARDVSAITLTNNAADVLIDVT